MEGQTNNTIVAGMSLWHAGNSRARRNHELLHGGLVNNTYGVGSGPHGSRVGGSVWVGAGDTVLASAALTQSRTTSTFSAVSRASGGSCGLVELLLMTQQQVPPSKTSLALGTFKRLLFGMGAFVSLQVF